MRIPLFGWLCGMDGGRLVVEGSFWRAESGERKAGGEDAMRWVKMPFVFVGLLCVAFWDLVRGNLRPWRCSWLFVLGFLLEMRK